MKNTISTDAIDTAMALALAMSENYCAFESELREIFRQAGMRVRSASGAYRAAVILDNAVLKVSLSKNRQDALRTEAEFINTMRADEQFGRHFPETHLIELAGVCVLVQEKIDLDHTDKYHMHDAVEKLAEHLGIEDMHEENFGWKGTYGNEYPVFIDVDLRSKFGVRNRRSWMV
jgi:hypothetical protein